MMRFLTTMAAAALCGQAVLADEPLREGTGQRRAALDEMELKPFDASLWNLLSDWKNGSPLDLAATEGNVVLIYTWAQYYPASMQQMRSMARLAKTYADQGLIIVGVHNQPRWEGAAEAAAAMGADFRLAHDATGEFRQRLKVDQDPDFYLIDRAGHLRYADIQTASVAEAVKALIAESREDATGIPDQIAAARRALEEAQRRTSQIHQNIDLVELPELPIPKPTEEAYKAAKWPTRWDAFEKDVLQWQDNQFGGQPEPERLLTLPEGPWFGGRAPSRDARAIVTYFWAPDRVPSYDKVQPKMDVLQRAHPRSLLVIGVATYNPPNDPNQFNVDPEEEERARKRFEQLVQQAERNRKYDHSIVVDMERVTYDALKSDSFGYSNNNTFPAPLAAIFSSDGIMRWIGNPLDSRFDSAVNHVLNNDPWVQTRRRIEQAYIEQRGAGGGR